MCSIDTTSNSKLIEELTTQLNKEPSDVIIMRSGFIILEKEYTRIIDFDGRTFHTFQHTSNSLLNVFRANQHSILICYKGRYSVKFFQYYLICFTVDGAAYVTPDRANQHPSPRKGGNGICPGTRLYSVPPNFLASAVNLLKSEIFALEPSFKS